MIAFPIAKCDKAKSLLDYIFDNMPDPIKEQKNKTKIKTQKMTHIYY